MNNFETYDEITDIYTSVDAPETTERDQNFSNPDLFLMFPSYSAKLKSAFAQLKTAKSLRIAKKGKPVDVIQVKEGRKWVDLVAFGAPATKKVVDTVNGLLKSKKLGKFCLDTNKCIRNDWTANVKNIPACHCEL